MTRSVSYALSLQFSTATPPRAVNSHTKLVCVLSASYTEQAYHGCLASRNRIFTIICLCVAIQSLPLLLLLLLPLLLGTLSTHVKTIERYKIVGDISQLPVSCLCAEICENLGYLTIVRRDFVKKIVSTSSHLLIENKKEMKIVQTCAVLWKTKILIFLLLQ